MHLLNPRHRMSIVSHLAQPKLKDCHSTFAGISNFPVRKRNGYLKPRIQANHLFMNTFNMFTSNLKNELNCESRRCSMKDFFNERDSVHL